MRFHLGAINPAVGSDLAISPRMTYVKTAPYAPTSTAAPAAPVTAISYTPPVLPSGIPNQQIPAYTTYIKQQIAAAQAGGSATLPATSSGQGARDAAALSPSTAPAAPTNAAPLPSSLPPADSALPSATSGAGVTSTPIATDVGTSQNKGSLIPLLLAAVAALSR